MNPKLLALIVGLCNVLHGPDLVTKRNYQSYACADQIKTCIETAGPTSNYMWPQDELTSCIGKYVKKNYRQKR